MSMRVNSYSVIHYGCDYIGYSLRSIFPFVDHSYILYTPHPSHGFTSDLPPIESRDEIMASIPADLWTPKLTWIDTTNFWQEGRQRDFALSVAAENVDLCIVLDYDELWPSETLQAMLDYVWRQNKARNWLLNFRHLWRSFNYICDDDAWPVRIIDTRHKDGVAYLSRELGPVYHFGYAIRNETMRYKLSCHGHHSELRPGWFEEKWLAWPPVDDCHPTNGRKANGEGWWNPQPFDKWQLPPIMYSHPFFNLERID